jgi:hypothetical protein
MNCKYAIAGAVMALLLAPATAQADSISSVEGARAKERQGAYLSRQDDEKLRRYGGNDDYRGYGYTSPSYAFGPAYGYGPYGGGYYDGYGSGVGIYVDID